MDRVDAPPGLQEPLHAHGSDSGSCRYGVNLEVWPQHELHEAGCAVMRELEDIKVGLSQQS